MIHNFIAGRVVINNFRALYSLNYKKLKVENRIEPTISVWFPGFVS